MQHKQQIEIGWVVVAAVVAVAAGHPSLMRAVGRIKKLGD